MYLLLQLIIMLLYFVLYSFFKANAFQRLRFWILLGDFMLERAVVLWGKNSCCKEVIGLQSVAMQRLHCYFSLWDSVVWGRTIFLYNISTHTFVCVELFLHVCNKNALSTKRIDLNICKNHCFTCTVNVTYLSDRIIYILFTQGIFEALKILYMFVDDVFVTFFLFLQWQTDVDVTI
jgi:hypothetical protein